MLENSSVTGECLEMTQMDQQNHEGPNQSVNELEHQGTADAVDQSEELCKDSSEKSVITDFSNEALQSQVEFTGKDSLVDNDQLATDLEDASELSNQLELTDKKDSSESSLNIQPIYKQQIQPTAIVIVAQPTIPRPPSYMALSIVTCVFCFFPTGILAMYFTCRASKMAAMGKMVEAYRYTHMVKCLIFGTVLLGLFVITILIVLIVEFRDHIALRDTENTKSFS